jgi:hypothetical protein
VPKFEPAHTAEHVSTPASYEAWKARYRATHGRPTAVDTAIYLAFATPTGVTSELRFVGSPSDEAPDVQRLYLLELCASALAGYKPKFPSEPAAVVEVRRKRVGYALRLGSMGAPEEGPLIPVADLLSRAQQDVLRLLERE